MLTTSVAVKEVLPAAYSADSTLVAVKVLLLNLGKEVTWQQYQ